MDANSGSRTPPCKSSISLPGGGLFSVPPAFSQGTTDPSLFSHQTTLSFSGHSSPAPSYGYRTARDVPAGPLPGLDQMKAGVNVYGRPTAPPAPFPGNSVWHMQLKEPFVDFHPIQAAGHQPLWVQRRRHTFLPDDQMTFTYDQVLTEDDPRIDGFFLLGSGKVGSSDDDPATERADTMRRDASWRKFRKCQVKKCGNVFMVTAVRNVDGQLEIAGSARVRCGWHHLKVRESHSA